MKIAILPSAFFPSLGGVEELVSKLAKAYIAAGHEVIIVTNRWPRNLPAWESVDGLEVHRLAFRVPTTSPRAVLSYWITHRLIRARLIRLLKAENVDLIHVQCVSSNGEYARHAAQALSVPLMVTTQGEITMDTQAIYQRDARLNVQLERLIAAADCVTAVSEKTLRDLELQLNHSVPGAVVIHNGTDVVEMTSHAPYQHPRPYVLALGRLVPEKGFEDLLVALSDARISHDVIIAGSGDLLDSLQALAGKLGMTERVFFIGPVDRATVARLHAGAEWFVLPSRADEGLPLAAVEALAAGSAMIGTRTGGLPEIVQDETHALLVGKGDVIALAAAMKRLDADAGLRTRLRSNASKAAVSLDWTVLADQYLNEMTAAVMRKERLS